MKNGDPRILIVRLSAIGDVVRALPVLHVLREAFHDAQIDWAIERKAAAIVEDHPLLDDLLVFERPEGWLESTKAFLGFCNRVRRNRYDVVMDLHGIFKSGMIAGFSRAKRRVGFARPRSREGSGLFTNRKVRLSSNRLNRVEENLALCEAVAPRVGWPSVTIYVPPEIQEYVEGYFEETFDGGKQIIAVHAPVDRPEKQWSLTNYAALCDLLLSDGRFEVLLTWGPGQREMVQRVVSLTRRNPVMAPETPDLKHFAWLVHLADLYVGGDTGPMHIASAMGTPVVALFGGTDSKKHAPYRPPYTVLDANELPPCDDEGAAPGAKELMQRVTPEMAYDACVKLLAKVGEESQGRQ